MGAVAMRRTVVFFLTSFLILATSALAASWFEPPKKRLTIGGTLVDALADFQRHGGQVDEVLTPDDLLGKPPQVFGMWHGRSVFGISGGKDGGLGGLLTVDGASVEANMTPDGFLEIKPDQAGVKNRNMELYRALFPDQDLSQYTTEAVFEFIDETGKRIMFGGSEDGKTTAFLLKKDPTTGEIVYKIRRDIARNKEAKEGTWVAPDESPTFPIRIKICDENRENCVVRNVIKKPGDEIRINPVTQAVKITFNKDVLPYFKKYGNAQRLGWACEYKGEGFYFTYREGFMGGDARRLPDRIGTLTCDKNVLCCKRTAPGQKCNFDYRDYLNDPPTLMLFGLNWLTSRLDRHKQYFTLTLDPKIEDHLRVKHFENLGCVKTLDPLLGPPRPGDDVNGPVYQALQKALCPEPGGVCQGKPSFSVFEVTGVGQGVALIDERTGAKLDGVRKATIYVLRDNYGTGKRGDFVAAVIDTREGGAVVSTLLDKNEKPPAPGIWEPADNLPPEAVGSLVEQMAKEEEAPVIQKTEVAANLRALVLFPPRHGWALAEGKEVEGGRHPARVVLLPPVRKATRVASAPLTEKPRPVAPPPKSWRPPEPSLSKGPTMRPKPRASLSAIFSYAPRPKPKPLPPSYEEPKQRQETYRVYEVSSPPIYRTAASDLGLEPEATRRASAVPLRVPLKPKAEVVELEPSKPRVEVVRMGPATTRQEVVFEAYKPEPTYKAVAPPPKPKSSSKPVAVARLKPKTSRPLRVTRALVREVQRRLKRQGYAVGRVDGRLGRKTIRAIKRFQRDVSLPATGRIDRRLLESLGIDSRDGFSRLQRAKRVRTARHVWRPSREQIREVQRRLSLIGYRPGPPDGVFGPRTARAVKLFQRRVGLKATGRIDKEILRRLSIIP
jgi:peptidoglycan hydrolase-like protein with peptidoglycan-binding domain